MSMADQAMSVQERNRIRQQLGDQVVALGFNRGEWNAIVNTYFNGAPGATYGDYLAAFNQLVRDEFTGQ